MQSPYATMRYDDRNDRLLMATTHGASYNYRYNWLYFINGSTAEIEKIIEMKRYFWFPSIPIFPDKHEAEISLEEINLTTLGEFEEIDLRPFLSDKDNIDRNIKIKVYEKETADSQRRRIKDADTVTSEEPNLSYSVSGQKLSLKMNEARAHTLVVEADSNGKTVSKEIPVKYDMNTGLDDLAKNSASVSYSNGILTALNMEGKNLCVYGIDGILCAQIEPDSNNFRCSLSLDHGIYLIKDQRGNSFKIINK